MNRIRLLCLLLVLCLPIGCRAASTAALPDPSPVPSASVRPTETPTPSPTESPVPSPSPTPVPTESPSPVPTEPPAPFGIVWLPDTQGIAYREPDKLTAIGQWIATHRDADRLAAVVHTGDIVDNGWKSWQWDNFDRLLCELPEDLPFFPVAGNHDLGLHLLEYGAYLERPFLDAFASEQRYEGGKMLYTVLNEGDAKLLLLGIGWGTGKTEAEQAWIDSVMQAHADLPCVVVTHAYLNRGNRPLGYAAYLNDTVLARYPNVRLLLCGHVHLGFASAENVYDDDGDGVPDRTVHILLLDDQENEQLYRVLTFDPVSRSIAVQTYRLGSDAPLPDDPIYGPADFVLDNAF